MNDGQTVDISYVDFGLSSLISNQNLLQDLAEFYCSIWMKDPNFGEYRICPTCARYFNEHEVEIKGITTCSGKNTPHPQVKLVPAWEPKKVADEELIGNASKYGNNFYGVYAIDRFTGKIIGFTWGWLENSETIRSKWGDKIASELGYLDSTYYSEIAVDPSPSYRHQGIGKELCRRLTTWMKMTHPHTPSFLRTHQTSFAKKMFEHVGYRYFDDDPQHGEGRIMLKVDAGHDLTP